MRDGVYRPFLLTTLTVVYAFNYLDRNVLVLLMEPIKADLQLSDTQMGLLTGIAFALFYATLGIPIARWADRGNRVTIISLTTAVWSVMVVLCGMATNFAQLLLARIGVAVGEAGCVPPAQSLISDYYSRRERPRAMSIYTLGTPLSMMIGFLAAGWINELYGWRAAFFAVGLPGVLLTLVTYFFLREPRVLGRRKAASSAAEISTQNQLSVFKTLWRRKSYRHLALAFTLIHLFSYGIAQWAPSFLIRTHHISTGELGTWYALIWGVGGVIGTCAGGLLVSRYLPDNERRQLKIIAAVLLGFIPLYLGIYLAQDIGAVFSLMTIAALIYSPIFGLIFAMLQQVVPSTMRATSVAVMLFLSNLISMGAGPIFVGVISDLLRPQFADESLRMALLMWTPGYLWAVFHLLRAAKYIDVDLSCSAPAAQNPVTTPGRLILQQKDANV